MFYYLRLVLCFFMFVPLFAHTSNISLENLPWLQKQDCLNRVSKFLPSNPIILEAGMHHGIDTLEMKKKWPKAKVYGFEPHPDSFQEALKNTKSLSNVFIYPYALCDKEGPEIFYMSKRNEGASSLFVDNTDTVKCPAYMTPPDGLNFRDVPTTVFCTTIDRWAQKNDVHHIDYLWLDTEGAELVILQNAANILPSVKVISIECNFKEYRKGISLFSDVYQFLTEKGFVLDCIWGNPEWQGDAIFVRHEI